MEEKDFIEVFKSENNEDMVKFLSLYGKNRKPICPFYYLTKEELEQLKEAKDGKDNRK